MSEHPDTHARSKGLIHANVHNGADAIALYERAEDAPACPAERDRPLREPVVETPAVGRHTPRTTGRYPGGAVIDFACIYDRFNPAVALGADDPAYVDWQKEVLGADVKDHLRNGVRLSLSGHIHRLFTGQRGGGKTTELLRLRQRLMSPPRGERPYFVSLLDVGDDDTFDLGDADPTDLVLAVARQLVSDLRERAPEALPSGGPKLRSFLEAAREVLRGVAGDGVDLSVGDPIGVVELSATLRRQPSERAEIRRLLEGRLPTLFDAINEELLPVARTALEEGGYAGVVVLVDTLDRIARGQQHHLFFEGRGKLKALACHVVYTAPTEYVYSRAMPALETEYGGILGLPLLPVADDDLAVRERARAQVESVVGERLTGCGTTALEVFGSHDALKLLIELSGGHMRSLLFLVRTAIERSDLSGPLDRAYLERVAREVAAGYFEALDPDERGVARRVHETRSRPDGDAERAVFSQLLGDQYVFNYVVGDRRYYDWNPLLGMSSLAR